MTELHGVEPKEVRFPFGQNWRKYSQLLDAQRILEAERSLTQLFGRDRFDQKRFLDIGCGSGLFSLAARRLGASVHSFDYDPVSVACTRSLRSQFRNEDQHWTIEEGSVLDREYLEKLGTFDFVYAWGVLHHTGDLWRALDNTASTVGVGGFLGVAIYNDQGVVSDYWRLVKRIYNRSGTARVAVTVFHAPYLIAARWLWHQLTGRSPERGMSLWYDARDWLGGWPFEVASPERVRLFLADRDLRLVSDNCVGSRHGCNEFVLVREPRR